jgi:hypothetical protein
MEESGVHEPLLFFLQVLIGAHDAAEVADAGGLDPEADGKVGKDGSPPFVVGENLEQTPVVADRTHAVTFLPEDELSVDLYHSAEILSTAPLEH